MEYLCCSAASAELDGEGFLEAKLRKHPTVAGVVVAQLHSESALLGATYCAGLASRAADDAHHGRAMRDDVSLQCGNLTKTVAAAFALETFADLRVDVDAPVNRTFRELHSDFALAPAEGAEASWAEDVTIAQLCEHTALGAYSVPGMKPGDLPGPMQLLKAAKGSRPVAVDRAPGVEFAYGDLGYLVLEALLELLLRKPVRYSIAPFLRRVGLSGFTFYSPSLDQADGYLDDGHRVEPRGGLVFPCLATGGRCPPAAFAGFLWHLAAAYRGAATDGPISTRTARRMLGEAHTVDGGSLAAFGAEAGLGVFVARCGPNRVMVHQAATDGFRGIYLVCFEGPDAAAGPTGFVACANGDEAASFLLSDVCQSMLRRLDWEGVDLGKVDNPQFAADMIKHAPSDMMVNTGYKDLVFKAFDPGPQAK